MSTRPKRSSIVERSRALCATVPRVRRLVPLLALLLLLSAPAAARALSAKTPLVVGDRAFTAPEIEAVARIGARDPKARHVDLSLGAWRVADTEWHRREAAARGIGVAPAALDAAVAADVRVHGGDAERTRYLALIGETVDQRRAEIADGLLAEAIIDDVLRRAGASPAAFGRAFDDIARRQRAATTCLRSVVGDLRGRCGNVVPKDGRCTTMAGEELCPIVDGKRRYWFVGGDVITAFVDPRRLAYADGDTVEHGVARIRRFLTAHGSSALRRCDTDPDDEAYIDCPRRADAIAVTWAIARVHAFAKRRWSVPASDGVIG
jgi:hypothetical protein